MPWRSPADPLLWRRGLKRGDRRAIACVLAGVVIGLAGHALLERRANDVPAVTLFVIALCGAAGWFRAQGANPP
ncbi:hypothetical protein [Roseomonas rosulenta]|uniref:hypothetical protein n=1 Tax=Roseomonas rosulenta TaxID=2748667 RepID=UPI0018E04B0F|nr:hypothetical protein [Roseomonas rosulenta]